MIILLVPRSSPASRLSFFFRAKPPLAFAVADPGPAVIVLTGDMINALSAVVADIALDVASGVVDPAGN